MSKPKLTFFGRERCKHEMWDCHVCGWRDGLSDEYHEDVLNDSEDSDSGLIGQPTILPPKNEE